MTTWTEKRFYQGQPGTSDTLLATVTTSTTWIVKQIVCANTDSASQTITIGLNSGATLAAANHILSAVSIAANTTYILDLSQVLNSTETIRGLQGSASKITVIISGIERT